MHTDLRQFVKALTDTALVTIFAIPQSLVAQSAEHVVSPTELQKAVVDASQKRQQNMDTLNQFFSSEKAQRGLESAHQNPEQIRRAVASLSDDDPTIRVADENDWAILTCKRPLRYCHVVCQ